MTQATLPRDLIESIIQFRNQTTSDTVNAQTILTFLQTAEQFRKLPDSGVSEQVVDYFLKNIVWLMTEQLQHEGTAKQSAEKRQDNARRALDILDSFIHNDARCQERFNPSRSVVESMNIGEYIANENRSIQKVDSLIEMCILIMEKNDHLDFFSVTRNGSESVMRVIRSSDRSVPLSASDPGGPPSSYSASKSIPLGGMKGKNPWDVLSDVLFL